MSKSSKKRKRTFQDARATDVEPVSKKAKTPNFDTIDDSMIKATDESNVCLQKVQIVLDRNIVHNYLMAKGTSSNSKARTKLSDSVTFADKFSQSNANDGTKKVMKQKTLTDYFKSNKVLDNKSLGQDKTLVGKRESALVANHNVSLILKCPVLAKACAAKLKVVQSESTDETLMNGNDYLGCDDDLDIGEEFKHSDFLSNVENTRVGSGVNESNDDLDVGKEYEPITVDMESGEKLDCAENVESAAKKSTDETIMNDNHAFIEDNDEDIDVGVETDYVAFLTSDTAQVDVLNGEVQEIDVKKKRIYTTRRSSRQKKERKRYECDYCGHKAYGKPSLKSHMENKHSKLYDENGVITCAECNHEFTTLRMFKWHKPICGTKPYYPCKFCSKLLATSYACKMHVIGQHEKEFDKGNLNEILKWSMSNKKRIALEQKAIPNSHLPKKRKLWRNYSDVKKLVKMFCSKCNITLKSKLGKTKSQCLECNTELMFRCQKCKKTFNKKVSAFNHVRWTCKDKENRKSTRNINKKVSKNVMEDNSNLYDLSSLPRENNTGKTSRIGYLYCHDCNFKAKVKSNLLRHIQFNHIGYHNTDGSVICPKCQRKFKYSGNFKAHQLVCCAIFHCECKFCTFSTTESSHMKFHLRSAHSDEIDGEKFKQIVNEIINERASMKENHEVAQRKKICFENKDLGDCFDLYKVLKMICPKCCVVSDRMKYQNVKYCSTCDKLLEYQCQRCGQIYDKYQSSWLHATKSCKMIKKKQTVT